MGTDLVSEGSSSSESSASDSNSSSQYSSCSLVSRSEPERPPPRAERAPPLLRERPYAESVPARLVEPSLTEPPLPRLGSSRSASASLSAYLFWKKGVRWRAAGSSSALMGGSSSEDFDRSEGAVRLLAASARRFGAMPPRPYSSGSGSTSSGILPQGRHVVFYVDQTECMSISLLVYIVSWKLLLELILSWNHETISENYISDKLLGSR